MSDKKFKGIFRGKQDILEEKIDVEHGLLSKLVADEVITSQHRIALEVSNCFYCTKLNTV